MLDVSKVSLDELGFKGAEIYHYKVISSTQAKACEIAEKGAHEGSIIIAETQTQGKGRKGRGWASPGGGLWFSVILRPRSNPKKALVIGLAAGYALVKILNEGFGIDARVSWPNDVMINGKKVAGILPDASIQGNLIEYLILGLGINVNFRSSDLPEEIRDKATTILEQLGEFVDCTRLLTMFLNSFIEVYDLVLESDPILTGMIKDKVDTMGQRVLITKDNIQIQGKAVNLDEFGGLVVEFENGEREIFYDGVATL